MNVLKTLDRIIDTSAALIGGPRYHMAKACVDHAADVGERPRDNDRDGRGVGTKPADKTIESELSVEASSGREGSGTEELRATQERIWQALDRMEKQHSGLSFQLTSAVDQAVERVVGRLAERRYASGKPSSATTILSGADPALEFQPVHLPHSSPEDANISSGHEKYFLSGDPPKSKDFEYYFIKRLANQLLVEQAPIEHTVVVEETGKARPAFYTFGRDFERGGQIAAVGSVQKDAGTDLKQLMEKIAGQLQEKGIESFKRLEIVANAGNPSWDSWVYTVTK